MKQFVTQGIVLSRVNFQEADRVITVLTSDQGKVKLMARGVRKIKSKLAGGIELFGVNQLTFIPGKGEIGTLVSSRMQTHYGNIIKDINRTMFGYELLKRINKVTEDTVEGIYFQLLSASLESLDDQAQAVETIEFWFNMRLLHITGHAPNLRTDSAKKPLDPDAKYEFNADDMVFQTLPNGEFGANHIKLLRLATQSKSPEVLTKVSNISELLPALVGLSRLLVGQQLHVKV